MRPLDASREGGTPALRISRRSAAGRHLSAYISRCSKSRKELPRRCLTNPDSGVISDVFRHSPQERLSSAATDLGDLRNQGMDGPRSTPGIQHSGFNKRHCLHISHWNSCCENAPPPDPSSPIYLEWRPVCLFPCFRWSTMSHNIRKSLIWHTPPQPPWASD